MRNIVDTITTKRKKITTITKIRFLKKQATYCYIQQHFFTQLSGKTKTNSFSQTKKQYIKEKYLNQTSTENRKGITKEWDVSQESGAKKLWRYTFLIRTTKSLLKLNISLFKGFQTQNVLVLFVLIFYVLFYQQRKLLPTLGEFSLLGDIWGYITF